MSVVHQWQCSYRTKCGRDVDAVKTNVGLPLFDGVTCKACKRAKTLTYIFGEQWNGQYDGLPKATPTHSA